LRRAARQGLAAGALGLFAAACAAQDGTDYRNVTTGKPLRAGVYGRIVVKGAVPPPVIYPDPVIANEPLVPANVKPVYLYVPPGLVRKWKQHCARWSACGQPVLFVRMDDSPSRWGKWRHLRDQLALQERD
jgi:hypothetical protein